MRSFLVAGLLALGALLAGCGAPADRQAADAAFMTIGSTPRAAVYLDGELIGNTPQRKVAISPGAHIVRLECSPCEVPQESTLTFSVEPHEIYTHDCTVFEEGEDVPAPVTDQDGRISVFSEPWSYVYVDGVLIGRSPKLEYPVVPGEHTMTFRCGTCSEPREESVSFHVAAGETWTHSVMEFEGEEPAEPIEPAEVVGTSYLTLSAAPPADILLDGKRVGSTPMKDYAIASGEHELKLRCISCLPAKEKTLLFNVRPGEHHKADFTFENE